MSTLSMAVKTPPTMGAAMRFMTSAPDGGVVSQGNQVHQYNSLGVSAEAGVLYPVFGLLLSTMIAAAAMQLKLRLGD